MKKISHLILMLSFLFLLACTNSKGFAPREISNTTITFVTESISSSYDKDILHKKIVYYFHPDGTYESFLGTELYDYGDYSYNKVGPNSAHVTCSYSAGSEDVAITCQNYTYGEAISFASKMQFEDATHGTWAITFSASNHYIDNEKGTFSIENFIPKGK